MARVIWTPEAIRDVDAILDYLLDAAPRRAERVISGILDATRSLPQFPRMGRMVPEFEREDLRELIQRRYRIIYRIDGNNVRVVAVWHSAIDVARRLGAV